MSYYEGYALNPHPPQGVSDIQWDARNFLCSPVFGLSPQTMGILSIGSGLIGFMFLKDWRKWISLIAGVGYGAAQFLLCKGGYNEY